MDLLATELKSRSRRDEAGSQSWGWPRAKFARLGLPPVLLSVAALVAVLGWQAAGDAYHVLLLAQASSYAIGALGLTLVFGFGGITLLGPSVYFGLSAYAMVALVDHGLPSAAAILISVALVAAAGLLLDLLLERLQLFYQAIASVAIAYVVQDLANSLSGLTGGQLGSSVPPISFGRLSLTTAGRQAIAGWIVVGVVVTLLAAMLSGRYGRSLALMRQDTAVAAGAGVPVGRIRAVIMVVGAILIGLSGMLHSAITGYITPDGTGVSLSFALIVIVAAGGTRSMFGTTLAAIGYVFINDQLASYPQLAQLVYGGALIVFLFLPKIAWRSTISRLRRRFARERGSGGSS